MREFGMRMLDNSRGQKQHMDKYPKGSTAADIDKLNEAFELLNMNYSGLQIGNPKDRISYIPDSIRCQAMVNAKTAGAKQCPKMVEVATLYNSSCVCDKHNEVKYLTLAGVDAVDYEYASRIRVQRSEAGDDEGASEDTSTIADDASVGRQSVFSRASGAKSMVKASKSK